MIVQEYGSSERRFQVLQSHFQRGIMPLLNQFQLSSIRQFSANTSTLLLADKNNTMK